MNTPIRRLGVVAFLLFAMLLVSSTWTQYVTAGRLNADSRNSRTLIDEISRERGPILAGQTTLVSSKPVEDVFKFQRTYDQSQVYAPVTGYYSLVYGATGIESAQSQLLSGTSDQQFYRRLADIVSGRQPVGATVELTIDPIVQQAAWDALGDQKGAVVALDPKTGNILALVSKPSYDPNVLASHDRSSVTAAWDALLADPDSPMTNRAIAGKLYPPGSVFKLVTAAAAIESGEYNENSVLPGPASLDLPQTSKNLPNSGGAPCGPNDEVSMTNALRISCNTAFGYLGMQLGGAAVKTQADKFGFDQDLRIPLRVTPSTIPDNLNKPQEAQTGIGQFETRVTPLQVAMVSAAIANDGEVMRPNLVSKVVAANLDVLDQPTPQSLGRAISPETADQLTTMMTTVVESGTGKNAQIDGVAVAGKTGTAQHAAGAAPHAWFTAFAPADDPQVAVAVVVESGGTAGDEASGGRTAAPVAKAVIEAVLGQ
jgi:peptidoglycan glycosyltransferase